MSITASLIGLLLVLLRFVKPIPRPGIYTLWSLVFIRLVFPFTFSSEVSLLNFAGSLIKKVVAVPVPVQESVNLTMTNMIGAANSYFPITYKADLLKTVFSTAALVWVVGAAAAVMTVISLYYLASSELRFYFMLLPC